MTIRLAVVGLGKMGLSHLSIANALDDFEVVAACDNSKLVTDVMGKTTGLTGFNDYDEVLRLDGLDAVLIATPYLLDYDYVVLLLGIAFLWKDAEAHRWLPWERTLLAFAWIVPWIARSLAELTLVPIGLMSALAVLGIALNRGIRASPSRHSRAASAR